MPWIRRCLYWVPVAVWMAIIFIASADARSAEHSSQFLEPFYRWLFPGISEQGLDSLMLLTRKIGHVLEYAILAVLVWCALRAWGRNGRLPWLRRHAAIATCVVVVYAMTDELHQSTVPTRTGTPVDVVIDAIGGAAGLAVVWALGKYFKRW